ncbi:MAG: hypothetical protein ACK4K2_03830 [Dehalococcoidia bacterium]
MFWFQACPRCRGDLYQGQDIYGLYIGCLQCGYVMNEAEEVALRAGGERLRASREMSLAR